ncbi:MAG TPA: hypothetical protein VFX88_19655 [Actinomycetota bacterium]|nr:hypothetical protein [Actinomycetota bacterium]
MTYVEVNGRPTWHEVHGAGRPDLVDRLVVIGSTTTPPARSAAA